MISINHYPSVFFLFRTEPLHTVYFSWFYLRTFYCLGVCNISLCFLVILVYKWRLNSRYFSLRFVPFSKNAAYCVFLFRATSFPVVLSCPTASAPLLPTPFSPRKHPSCQLSGSRRSTQTFDSSASPQEWVLRVRNSKPYYQLLDPPANRYNSKAPITDITIRTDSADSH